MLDWNVGSEEEQAMPARPDEQPGSAPWRGTLLLALVIAVALIGALQWRWADQRRQIQADLTELVLQEERVRAAGQPTEARRLAIPNADEAWLRGYLAGFEPTDAPPRQAEVSVGAIEGDGVQALAEVFIDADRELRAYRREGGRWRRAPIPDEAWGAEARLDAGPIAIEFRERDRPFVERLAAELPAWSSEGWGEIALLRFEPEEFTFATILGPEQGRVVLNSPLTALREAGLDGETTVRLAAARLVRPLPESEQRIPQSAARVRAALREVAALRAVLPPRAYSERVGAWRGTVGEWRSPFFVAGATRPEIDSWQPSAIEAVALLTAHALYERRGAAGVAALALESTTHESWDDLFHRLWDQYTVEVEREVLATLGLPVPDEPLFPEGLPRFPQTATILREGSDIFFSIGSFFVDIAGDGTDESVVADASAAEATFPDGSPARVACASRYSQVELSGDWTEPGVAMHVTHIRLPNEMPPPLAIEPAPEGTVGYRIVTLPTGGNQMTDLFGAVQGSGRPFIGLFESVRGMAIFPLEGAVDEPSRYLLVWPDEPCQQLWFYLYEGGRGIVRSWNSPPKIWRPSEALWNRATESVVVTLYDSAGAFYTLTLAPENADRIVAAGAELPGEYQLIGWGPDDRERPLAVHRSLGTLARIELSTGAIEPLPTGRVRVGRALPPRVEGNELIFSPPGIWSYGWRSYALDLTSAGERVRPILDGISLTALREGHPLAVGVLAFGTPDAATAVVERSSGAILATLPMPPGRHPAALCADGSILFTASPISPPPGLYRWSASGGLELLTAEPTGVSEGRIGCP